MRQMLIYVALLGIAPSAHAGASVWIAGTGNWNTPGNWSSGDVPDSAGEVAVIGLPTAFVTLDVAASPDGVAITDAAARLNLGGFTLNVTPLGFDSTGLVVANTGTSTIIGNLSNTGPGPGRGIEVTGGAALALVSPVITNSGRIDINPTNAGAVTLLRFDTDTALNGSGTLSLSGIVNRAQLSTSGAFVLTQASSHTIRGVGQLHAAIINNGIVSADVPGNTLTLLTNSKTNNFLMRALNSAFLDITSITVTQDPSASIVGDAATVRISSSAIDQGTLESTNGGLISLLSGTNTLTSVALVGTVEATGGTLTAVHGTGVLNHGTLNINPTNAGAVTALQFNENGNLSGAGELLLSGIVNRAQLNTAASVVVTNDASHTIRGVGQINADLVNNGLVEATVAGNTLTLQGSSKTNNSILQALNGSFLDITGITITQTPFSVIAGDASTVRLSSVTIDQGTLQAVSGGLISLISGTNTLDSITLAGPASATGGTATVIRGPGLNILDTFEINPTNAGAVTTLHFEDTGNLSGGGTLLMSGTVNRSQVNAGPGVIVSNDPLNTIRGVGQINAPVVNNGFIRADSAGNTLTLLTNAKENNSLIEAVNGAFLDITAITVTQSPFGVISADASTVRLSSSHIDQGTLDATNGGLISLISGTNTLTSVVLSGPAETTGGTATVIKGTGLINQQTLTINPINAGIVTTLHIAEAGSLTGPGALVLAGIANRAQLNTAPGVVVTNDAGHTIRGVGQINADLVNNGLIEATVAGNTLTLQTSPKTNNSVFQALNGSFLDITGITVTQGDFAECLADASTIRLSSATLSRGTLRAINGGLTQVVTGTNTLNDLTNQSPIDQIGGTAINVTGDGLTNHATIQVNPINAGLVTTFTFPAGGSLNGTGTLLLAGSTNRSILAATSGTITQGSGHTIGGIGQITAAALVNNGTIAPGLSVGTLSILGGVTQGAGGVLDLELGGTAAGQFDVLAGTGTINLDGLLRARFTNGHFPAGTAVYPVVTTTNRPGRFAGVDLPALDAGRTWHVEYLPAAIRLAAGPHCFGDATFDNVVNFGDVTAVLANFGGDYSPAPGTGPGDSNRDGVVNFADITSTLANFNAACP